MKMMPISLMTVMKVKISNQVILCPLSMILKMKSREKKIPRMVVKRLKSLVMKRVKKNM